MSSKVTVFPKAGNKEQCAVSATSFFKVNMKTARIDAHTLASVCQSLYGAGHVVIDEEDIRKMLMSLIDQNSDLEAVRESVRGLIVEILGKDGMCQDFINSTQKGIEAAIEAVRGMKEDVGMLEKETSRANRMEKYCKTVGEEIVRLENKFASTKQQLELLKSRCRIKGPVTPEKVMGSEFLISEAMIGEVMINTSSTEDSSGVTAVRLDDEVASNKAQLELMKLAGELRNAEKHQGGIIADKPSSKPSISDEYDSEEYKHRIAIRFKGGETLMLPMFYRDLNQALETANKITSLSTTTLKEELCAFVF